MSAKSPNLTDKHVGNRIRMRRMMLGLSQTALADTLGITFQQVQKYEKGVNRVGASRLLAISQTLGVSVSFLFEGAPDVDTYGVLSDATPSPDFAGFLATAEGLALARAFSRIANPAVRQHIVHLVEVLAFQPSAALTAS
jgi:transcriptional regulator with XRE-family HTH domain